MDGNRRRLNSWPAIRGASAVPRAECFPAATRAESGFLAHQGSRSVEPDVHSQACSRRGESRAHCCFVEALHERTGLALPLWPVAVSRRTHDGSFDQLSGSPAVPIMRAAVIRKTSKVDLDPDVYSLKPNS